MSRRSPVWATHTALAATLTWVLTFSILAVVLISGGSAAQSGGSDGTGGRTTAVVLALVALIPLAITRIDWRVPKWVAVIAFAVSVSLSFALWGLVTSGRDASAWSLYGGLQVLRAPQSFADLGHVLRAIDCGGCDGYANYGSAVAWLKPLTLGVFSESRLDLIGLVLIGAMSFMLAAIAWKSLPMSRLMLTVVSAGSAWLLLLDRANLDMFALAIPVIAVVLLRRRDALWVWFLFAAAIWIVGTWKYYPFALGIMLVPALRLRYGWTVLTAFATATIVYIVTAWSEIADSSAEYGTFTVLEDFPAVGRLPVTVRMIGDGSLISSEFLAAVLLATTVLAAMLWGFVAARNTSLNHSWEAFIALPNAAVFLVVVLIGGFGFGYKVVFIVLALPLAALLANQASRSLVYAGVVLTALIMIPSLVSYSILLTSLSALIAAGFIAGSAGLLVGRYTWPKARLFRAVSNQPT